MDNFRKSVYLHPNGQQDLVKIISVLLVTSFFYEFELIPKFEAGFYACKEFIQYYNNPKVVFKSLNKLHGLNIKLIINSKLLAILDKVNIFSIYYIYQKRIVFFMSYLEEIISIQIKFNDHNKQKISGFPHNMLWFIQQQKLESIFGTLYYDISSKFDCQACIFVSQQVCDLSYRKR